MDLEKFSDLHETKESIIEKLEYLKGGGLDDYLTFALSEIGIKKLPSKKADQIIEQIISKSPNDLNEKVKHKEHYKAHLCAIKFVLDEMFLHDNFLDNLKNYNVEEEKDMVVFNYHKLISSLLFDMVLLLQDYNYIINKKAPEKFQVGKNMFQSDFTLYQLLPQVIFGQVSFHSYIDKEPFASIVIIRQVLEIRIRRAFGILGIYDKTKESFEPFGLGQILDILKKYQNNIDFAVPLANIVRINGWANIFVHSGMKDYIWTVMYVYRYLHPLIKGRKDGKSWSSNSGIKLKQQTLNEIINEIELNLKNVNPNYELHKSDPDIFIVS